MRKLSNQNFIDNANKVHSYKYSYNELEYINSRTKIKIICLDHGLFYQTPNSHCKGRGCPKCSNTASLTNDEILKRFYNAHGNTYDYSKAIFNGNWSKIIIICKSHGDFVQAPQQHFTQGCPACAGVKKLTTQEFINKANIIHNNYYDYSNTIYICRSEKVKIICPKHGAFIQNSNAHLCGKGCIKCSTSISHKETKWLNYLGIPNDSLHRNIFIHFNGMRFNVDGYYAKSKIVYEFLGDYWHGNPARYNLDDLNRSCKKTYRELFNNTINKIQLLRKNGFKVICIWESQFDRKFF